MNKRKQTHILRLPDRTCTVVILERKHYVLFLVQLTRYGWSCEADFEAFRNWLQPLLDHYEDDPRPIVMPHPRTGQLAVIGGAA